MNIYYLFSLQLPHGNEQYRMLHCYIDEVTGIEILLFLDNESAQT